MTESLQTWISACCELLFKLLAIQWKAIQLNVIKLNVPIIVLNIKQEKANIFISKEKGK